MGLFDWLTGKNKSLSDMTAQELRKQELLLESERNLMLKRIEVLARQKQGLFDQGAKEKSPEVRRTLAQDFEMKTTEQLLVSRQLNIRTKEKMTVSRMRMLRENAERAKASGDRIGMIGERDVLTLTKLIENENVTSEMYQERLDQLLDAGAVVSEGASGLSEAGQAVVDIWNKMDAGGITDSTEAFDEADRRVREQKAASQE